MDQDGRPAVWVVLTAAGSGSRLGAKEPKALVTCKGKTLLELALERVLALPGLQGVVVTCPAGLEGDFAAVAPTSPVPLDFVEGGASRQGSVKRGLDALLPSVPGSHIVDGRPAS